MTALLGGGDIAIGAIGTVTYVDGSTILGFGHPFLSAGRSRFLMSDGYVFQTVAAPITNGSYKLAEPGVLRGMITGDRADGISGTIGPVEGIDAVGTARDLGRGTASTVRGTIAPDPRTAPIVGGLVQDEPAVRVLDGIEGGTLSLRVVISQPRPGETGRLPQPLRGRGRCDHAGERPGAAAAVGADGERRPPGGRLEGQRLPDAAATGARGADHRRPHLARGGCGPGRGPRCGWCCSPGRRRPAPFGCPSASPPASVPAR